MLLQLLYLSWFHRWHVEFFVNPNNIIFFNVCLAYLRHGTGTRCLSEHSPAATADHMTKNIPTAILFKEEGSRPRCFRMGSTTLSFRGISRRMSTASNMVSQAAGKRNVNYWVWTKERTRWNRSKKEKNTKTKTIKTNYSTATQNVNALEHSSCRSVCVCVCVISWYCFSTPRWSWPKQFNENHRLVKKQETVVQNQLSDPPSQMNLVHDSCFHIFTCH